MPEIKLEYPEMTICTECNSPAQLGTNQCSQCGHNQYVIHLGDMLEMQSDMRLQDARFGGLVLGRPGPEDDIPMFQGIGENLFRICGLMQGMEFILSAAATHRYPKELHQINSEKGDYSKISLLEIPSDCPVLDTNQAKPLQEGIPSCAVWVDKRGQFIINRYATRVHLRRLIEINKSCAGL